MLKSNPSWLNFLFKDFVRGLNPYKNEKGGVKFFFGNMLSGGIAGGMSLAVTYPFVVSSQLLATEFGTSQFTGMKDALS